MPLPTPDGSPRRYVCEIDRACAQCGALEAAHLNTKAPLDHVYVEAAGVPAFFLKSQSVEIASRRATTLRLTLGATHLLPSVQTDELLKMNRETFLKIIDHGESIFLAGDRVDDPAKLFDTLQTMTDADRVFEICFAADKMETLDAVGKAPVASPSSGAISSAKPTTPDSATP